MSDSPAASLEALSSSLSDVVAATTPCVVAVHSRHSLSSGFAWRPDLVVTADEALAEEGEMVVAPLAGGDNRPATVVGRDPTTDIALLRVDGAALAPATLAERPIRAGALALVVGAGADAALSALGSVAYAGPSWHSMRGGAIDARIELDLRLRRQAEGGLAVDATGRAFGMAVFGPRRRTLVIPAATIERVATRLQSHGRIPRGYLGLGLQPVRIEGDGAIGAMIVSVAKDGPGAAAGIRQGDVIVTWGGQPVPRIGTLLRELGPDSVGRNVSLGLRRGGNALELTLTIGERPPA
jgi:S1-C subfamily serine protease